MLDIFLNFFPDIVYEDLGIFEALVKIDFKLFSREENISFTLNS